MRLAFAMLADAAVAMPNGTITIQGGNLDVVYAPSVPAVHPKLTLVVILVAEPNDHTNQQYMLAIEGTMPQGEPWFRAESPAFSGREPDKAGRPAKYTFVVNLPMLVLLTEGEYTIRLLLGNEELTTLPLWVEVGAPADTKGED